MNPSTPPHAAPPPGIGRAIVLITGIQAAGKSTIAQALAEHLPRSVHVRGDVFRRMVVGGRAEMTPQPSDEAVRQLRLRYRLGAHVSDAYFEAGFTVVTQDVILGEHLAEMITLIRGRPLLVIVLAPQPTAVAAREAARGKNAYGRWAVSQLDNTLRHHTPASDCGSIPRTRPPQKRWPRSSPAAGPKPGSWSRSHEQAGVGVVDRHTHYGSAETQRRVPPAVAPRQRNAITFRDRHNDTPVGVILSDVPLPRCAMRRRPPSGEPALLWMSRGTPAD